MAVLAERMRGFDGAVGEIIDFMVERTHEPYVPIAEEHERQCNEAFERTPGVRLELDGAFLLTGDAQEHDGGIKLTDAINSQHGSSMFMKCFSNEGEVKVKFRYTMDHGNGADGLCVALVDPANPWCLLEGDYGGGLGFNSKPGSLVGIGLDSWGNFGAGAHHVVVKAGERHGFSLIGACGCDVLGTKDLKVKFDLDDDKANVQVKLDGDKVIDECVIEGIHLPDAMALVFTASTGACNNFHGVWDIKIKEEFDWDD